MNEPKLPLKERMQIDRQKMPEQEAVRRNGNFEEVNLGFSEKMALLEAQRCLQCKDPKCVQGCPVMVNIPRFHRAASSQGNLPGAARSLLGDNALPAVTGRVCPQETQCEVECIRGQKGQPVAIGYLERFVADWARAHSGVVRIEAHPATGKKVAVVGGGPAGLTAAGELVKLGHEVTVYEALHKPGGVLVYGIPEFRLPKQIVEEEVERLEQAGVKIDCNVVIGRTYTLPELRERFDAVFIANGAGLPVFMNVPGENFKGVYSANEYLTRVNLMAAYQFPTPTPRCCARKRVAVVGGGNVAMDAVRTAKRLGAERAILVYRRSRAEMPARVEEIHHAEPKGSNLNSWWRRSKSSATTRNGSPGSNASAWNWANPMPPAGAGPIPIPGSEFVLPCDVVVVAIGTRANPLLTATCPELKLNKWGNIEVDEHGMTSIPGVFAGGDIVRGAATVILAMGDGKRSAQAIDAWLATHQ